MTDPNLTFVFYSRQLVLGSFLRSVVCSPKNQTAVDGPSWEYGRLY